MHVAGADSAGSARVAVSHRYHDRLLEAEDVVDLALPAESLHDRELGGARIAEQILDAFGSEQAQERGTPVDLDHVLFRAECGR